MKLVIDLPDYDGNALDVIWKNEAKYMVHGNGTFVNIEANKEGLITFAKQMLYLAYNDLPCGSHIHFDEFFTKIPEYELVISKMED